MNKRGISAVVATVLIILITIAAITIVWTAIIPMIQKNLAFSELEGRVSVVSSEGYTLYDADKDLAMVQVKRDFDDGVMDRIRIIFSIEGNSYGNLVMAPGPGLTKAYTFNLEGCDKPDSVSVAPIFIFGNTEKEESVTSEGKIFSGEILDVATVIYELEKGCVHEIPYGVVGWWNFDDNDATDSSGNGNDGTVVNATWTSDGKVGGAYEFDGVDDYVEVTGLTANTLFENTMFSVSAWIKTSMASTRIVISKGGTGGGSQSGWMFRIENGKMHALTKAGALNAISRVSSSTVNDSEWHFVTAVFTTDMTITDNNDADIYIDGVLNNGAITKTSPPIFSSATVQIGRRPDGGYFNGLIDEVKIYNRALSEEQIISIYTS